MKNYTKPYIVSTVAAKVAVLGAPKFSNLADSNQIGTAPAYEADE